MATSRLDLLLAGIAIAAGLAVFFQPLAWLFGAWLSDPYYSHGFLVPVIAAFLVWRAKGRLALLPAAPSRIGLALLALALLLAVAAISRQAYFAASLSLPFALAGVVLYLKGWASLHALLFPFAYLVLMIPLPFVGDLALRLQAWTSTLSALAANLAGVPAQADGSTVSIPRADFVVGLACSGLSSIIALLALGTLLVFSLQGRGWAKAILVASIFPIAVVSNGLRVASLLWVASRFGSEAGLRYHDTVAGFLSWGLAVALLLLGSRLLRCRLDLAAWS